jgi:bifunctional DNase/RNase
MVRMEVFDLAVDEAAGSVLLVLQGDAGESLVMAIGLPEATAIAKEIQDVDFPRPLTHDLMRDIVAGLGGNLERVEVIALREGTYFAELVVRDASGQLRRFDSRPSDAIALALRTDAAIFADEQVLTKAESEAQEFPPPTDKEGWKKILEEMDPEDFGKWKM